MIADQFAREADFLSIGTNDLTQYTLAMDRDESRARAAGRRAASRGAAPHRAHGGGRARARASGWACAARSRAIPTRCRVLLGLGVDELSVDVPVIPAVKARVRALSMAECQVIAREALEAEDGAAVRAIVARHRARITTRAEHEHELHTRGVRMAAEDRQVADASGLGAARGRHSARRRQREVRGAAAVVSNVMAQAGGAIFGNLPLIFAIGVALGLTGNDGVAALAAVVGFAVMLATMGVMAPLLALRAHADHGHSVDRDGRVRRHPDRRRRRDPVQSLFTG